MYHFDMVAKCRPGEQPRVGAADMGFMLTSAASFTSKSGHLERTSEHPSHGLYEYLILFSWTGSDKTAVLSPAPNLRKSDGTDETPPLDAGNW